MKSRMTSIIVPLLLLAAGVASILYYKNELTAWYGRLMSSLAAPPPVVVEPTVVEPEPPAPPAEPEPPAPEPPAPAPEPAPEPPRPPVRPTERAHSAEHATVLQVAAALQPEAAEEQLQALVEQGKLSEQDAQALREWAQKHPGFKVEEVGLAETEPGSGQRETRYRLVAPPATAAAQGPATAAEGAEGQPQPAEGTEGQQAEGTEAAAAAQEVIISVVTPKQGQPGISRVQMATADRTEVTAQSDALTVVEGFVEALKRGDMGAARRLTTGGADISDATLAGLCIMFEEGDFAMRKKLPIRNMFKTEGNAGYIIHMAPHDAGAAAGSVGIEMSYDAEKGWGVKAVAMDNLLNRYEASGEAEGGVYFPLVKNPQGGDSLVLYFGFNDATPSPRSLSQLRIVANLLKGSQRALNISGHTDDVGTAQYNQELSERRAQAVKEALIAHGVSEEQITTRGLGKSQPRRTYRPGDNMETIRTIRSGNRRAEIYLDF